MTYNDIYLNYKTNTAFQILFNNKKIKNRLIKWGVIFIVGIILISVFLEWFNSKTNEGKEIYHIAMFTYIAIWLIIIAKNKHLTLDLLKIYSIIDFSDAEKKDRGAILDKIQVNKIQSLLGERKNDINYIKQLLEFSKEFSEYSKVKLISFKEVGFGAVIILLLNYYFSSLFKKWEVLNSLDFTAKTAAVFYILTVIIYVYCILRGLVYDWMNKTHKEHQELYFILKKIEGIALDKEYKKNKESF